MTQYTTYKSQILTSEDVPDDELPLTETAAEASNSYSSAIFPSFTRAYKD